jgi:hypothetical protein
MPKPLSLADLKQIAIAKHGKEKAWSLAYIYGSPVAKATWQRVIRKSCGVNKKGFGVLKR